MKAIYRSTIKETSGRTAISQMMPAINGTTIRNGVYLFKPYRRLKFDV